MEDSAPVNSGSFDELIFKRELNEVYLLLDFISGRPDAHIWNLDVDVPARDKPGQKESPFDLYLRISQMRYPPADGPNDKAYDATVLLYVKDRLNSIAAPARGATIAYTYMYLAEYLPKSISGDPKANETQTKATVAMNAFPGLEPSAKRLRSRRKVISISGTVVFIVATYLLCWTVYGSILNKRFEDDRQSALNLEKDVYTQLIADKVAGTSKDVNGSVARVCCWDTVTKLSPAAQGLCGNWSYFQARYNKAIADAGEYAADSRFLTFFLPTASVKPRRSTAACEECATCSRASKDTVPASDVASATSTPSGSATVVIGPNASVASTTSAEANLDAVPGSNRLADFRQEDVQSVGLIVSVYSTYVLPLFFGFVGTVAAFLRDVGNKALSSTLAPRDESLAGVRLLLGAIAGIAVGLFYNPTASAQQVTSGLGVMTLSASAIAFLAGYAADVFFNFLDNVSSRVFTLGGGSAPSK
jgi:hypothetical protein